MTYTSGSISATPSHKKNGHSGHRQLAPELQKLLDDLSAVEDLRRQNQRQLRGLRAAVYMAARELDVAPRTLKALLALRNGGGRRAR
jgi:hypothetical protein